MELNELINSFFGEEKENFIEKKEKNKILFIHNKHNVTFEFKRNVNGFIINSYNTEIKKITPALSENNIKKIILGDLNIFNDKEENIVITIPNKGIPNFKFKEFSLDLTIETYHDLVKKNFRPDFLKKIIIYSCPHQEWWINIESFFAETVNSFVFLNKIFKDYDHNIIPAEIVFKSSSLQKYINNINYTGKIISAKLFDGYCLADITYLMTLATQFKNPQKFLSHVDVISKYNTEEYTSLYNVIKSAIFTNKKINFHIESRTFIQKNKNIVVEYLNSLPKEEIEINEIFKKIFSENTRFELIDEKNKLILEGILMRNCVYDKLRSIEEGVCAIYKFTYNNVIYNVQISFIGNVGNIQSLSVNEIRKFANEIADDDAISYVNNLLDSFKKLYINKNNFNKRIDDLFDLREYIGDLIETNRSSFTELTKLIDDYKKSEIKQEKNINKYYFGDKNVKYPYNSYD